MSSVWDDVVGQGDTVDVLRDSAADPAARLPVRGPARSTKRQAARAFAAMILTGSTTRPRATPASCSPASIPTFARSSGSGARSPRTQAATSSARIPRPHEGDRKVMVLHEFHLLSPDAASVLLKVVEEPPPSTVFVILADFSRPTW
jgi:DNA polymerase III subunit delta'